ncbi:hypothetical protein OG936_38020 [Streptomyces sp. NBC_00846]|uniref:hypothetical protein n=1 Tax=Streptomyces sp. NBC_00846 TaxID=2975849 RepID=UPI003869342A|nr:hypothetical protein OG936_38020 [Streptomyces sp. NBC_00846]
MPAIVLLIVLLLVLVALMGAGGLAYLVHRHHTLAAPVVTAMGTLTGMVAVVSLILTAGK